MSKNIVLMYHDIVTTIDNKTGFQNPSAFQYKVDVAKFEEQVKAAQGTNTIFTFDDGGVSFYTEAAPILEKYGKKGIFFISTKYLNTPGFLASEQVKSLDSRGHVIGSHSHSHPTNMSMLNKSEILFEWKESVHILSELLGHPVTIASIPNGYDSNEIIDAACKVGIIELHTSKPIDNEKWHNGCKLVGRYVVHENMTNEYVRKLLINSYIRKGIYWRWLLVSIVKKILGNKYDKVKMLLLRRKV